MITVTAAATTEEVTPAETAVVAEMEVVATDR